MGYIMHVPRLLYIHYIRRFLLSPHAEIPH